MSKVAFEHFSERMEKLSKKLEAFESDMNKKLDELSERIESYRKEVQ